VLAAEPHILRQIAAFFGFRVYRNAESGRLSLTPAKVALLRAGKLDDDEERAP
jgi:hypothetical protein